MKKLSLSNDAALASIIFAFYHIWKASYIFNWYSSGNHNCLFKEWTNVIHTFDIQVDERVETLAQCNQ